MTWAPKAALSRSFHFSFGLPRRARELQPQCPASLCDLAGVVVQQGPLRSLAERLAPSADVRQRCLRTGRQLPSGSHRSHHETYGLDHELGCLGGNDVTDVRGVHQDAVRRTPGEIGWVAGGVRVQDDDWAIPERGIEQLGRFCPRVEGSRAGQTDIRRARVNWRRSGRRPRLDT